MQTKDAVHGFDENGLWAKQKVNYNYRKPVSWYQSHGYATSGERRKVQKSTGKTTMSNI